MFCWYYGFIVWPIWQHEGAEFISHVHYYFQPYRGIQDMLASLLRCLLSSLYTIDKKGAFKDLCAFLGLDN